jgi:hypothetical protein
MKRLIIPSFAAKSAIGLGIVSAIALGLAIVIGDRHSTPVLAAQGYNDHYLDGLHAMQARASNTVNLASVFDFLAPVEINGP